MTKVVSIQYPSGGFGHFIHVILSKYGCGFSGQQIKYNFGVGGDSHAYPVLLPKYFTTNYDINAYTQYLNNIDSEFVTVLIDSGIENDSNEFRKFIKSYWSIRICYDDWSWPLLAKMFYTRCMSAVNAQPQHLSQWISPSENQWPDIDADWAKREKFFLYLRDHTFRNNWRADSDSDLNLPITHLLDYNLLHNSLNSLIEVDDFDEFYRQWYDANQEHFDFYLKANEIISQLDNNMDISDVSDLYTQAVVYYYIWLKFKFEIPHNDYAKWFTNTKEIVTMLKDHGVNIDPY
jgi:hypothetical protein